MRLYFFSHAECLGQSLTQHTACLLVDLGNNGERKGEREEKQIWPEASPAEEGFSLLSKDKSDMGWRGRKPGNGERKTRRFRGAASAFAVTTKGVELNDKQIREDLIQLKII